MAACGAGHVGSDENDCNTNVHRSHLVRGIHDKFIWTLMFVLAGSQTGNQKEIVRSKIHVSLPAVVCPPFCLPTPMWESRTEDKQCGTRTSAQEPPLVQGVECSSLQEQQWKMDEIISASIVLQIATNFCRIILNKTLGRELPHRF